MVVKVFVLHYNNDERTAKCVASLNGYGFDVHIIDNGSIIPSPEQTTIRLPQNMPIIDAFNVGIRKYPADIYICAGDDHIFQPDTIHKLIDALSDPSVGIVAPGTSDIGAGSLYVPALGAYSDIEAHHVDNSVWGWRHDLIDAIGLPDCTGHTHHKCWASNADYCYRARLAGYKVMAVRSAYVQKGHNGGNDTEAWEAGRLWLVSKYGADKANAIWA